MKAAVEAIRNKEMGSYKTSRVFSLPQTTLQRYVNLLKPNDIYICRTAAITSRRSILNIYSTNIRIEYFKRAA